MNKIETTRGVLKYRNPTIIENMKLLKAAKLGLSTGDIMDAKIAVMENIEPLLDFSEMKDVKSFDDLNNLGDEMTYHLAGIADNILDKIIGVFTKKP
jgi:hypothetical protein